MAQELGKQQIQVAATSFLALFSIVGLVLYGLPLFYDFMFKELGWSRTLITSGNALSKIVVGPLFGFIAGWIIDRFGPRRLMMIGILMTGIALMGLSVVSTVTFFYFFYLLNALGYVCGGPLPNQVLLSRWFDKARGKAMGFAYLGIGIAGALVPWIVMHIEKRYGWHVALQTLGLMVIVISLPMAYFVKESPENVEIKKDTTQVPIKWIFREPAFYLLAIGSMCSIGAVGGTMQNLKLYLTLDQHYTQADFAGVASKVLIFSIVGRLLMGWLADIFPKKYVMLLIYMIVAMSIPFLFYANSPSMILIFVILFGIGLGGDYMIIPLMAAELFGVKVLGRLMGIVITADGVAEAVFPMLVASLRDQKGSYTIGFIVLIGLALLGAFAIALLPKRRLENS
jgi:sugar phosphate permease